MKPFPGKYLEQRKNIFNYRLSRGRRVIENAFGILTSRWRILRKPLNCHPKTADKIVMTCVCLHNFLINNTKQIKATYCPSSFVDKENENGDVTLGEWRNDENVNSAFSSLAHNRIHHSPREAYDMREVLTNYFTSPNGEIPWQWEYINRGKHKA